MGLPRLMTLGCAGCAGMCPCKSKPQSSLGDLSPAVQSLCTQWANDPSSPLYSSDPTAMANAELYCLYGPNNGLTVRAPSILPFPGSSFAGGIATSTAPNPILGTSSTPLDASGGLSNPQTQLTILQQAAQGVPQGLYNFDNWLLGNDSNGNPLPSTTPGWVWILAAVAAGAVVLNAVR